MGGIRIKDEVTFPQPSGVGWWGEAEEFGEAIGFQHADVVITKCGEPSSIAGSGHPIEAQRCVGRGFLFPIGATKDAYPSGASRDDPLGAQSADLRDLFIRAKGVHVFGIGKRPHFRSVFPITAGDKPRSSGADRGNECAFLLDGDEAWLLLGYDDEMTGAIVAENQFGSIGTGVAEEIAMSFQ